MADTVAEESGVAVTVMTTVEVLDTVDIRLADRSRSAALEEPEEVLRELEIARLSVPLTSGAPSSYPQ